MGLFQRWQPAHPYDINITTPAFHADPYPYYARLRAECPVCRVTLPTGEPAWLITRYDDVALVLKDGRFVRDVANALTPAELARQPWFRKLFQGWKAFSRNLLNVDPPNHTRLRGLVNLAFTPSFVERLRGRIQQLSDELLDAVQPRGHMDLMHAYALPLPMTIIAEMLGVPTRDLSRFERWLNGLVAASSSMWAIVLAIPKAWSFLRYLRRIVAERRANPRDDLVSALVRAEEAGDQLSNDELVAMLLILLVAGYETTASLIGNGMLTLLQHPDQLERLRQEPALLKSAIEELVRHVSPVNITAQRYTREDVPLGGVVIPRGQLVFAITASANRDERRFANPDALDLGRDPNPHLGFGLGPRFCIGAALARLEGQIGIGTLVRRLPRLQLAVPADQLRWKRGPLRNLVELPVRF